jgi:putative ATPase
LLPAVEDGTVSLIGATTENPSFEVNGALLSRCRVLTLPPLDADDITALVKRALEDPERGLARLHPLLDDAAIARLAQAAGGDARVALAALEAAVLAAAETLGRARFAYDKGGEDHYSLISSLVPGWPRARAGLPVAVDVSDLRYQASLGRGPSPTRLRPSGQPVLIQSWNGPMN